MKNYIYTFTKDENYFYNKGKIGSWGRSGIHYIAYNTISIVDTEGCHIIDLTKETSFSKKLLNPMNKQEANRIYYLLDYLKPTIDIERIKYKYEKM